MIFENCIGNNLLDQMVERENIGKTLSEKESALIFKQIISAITYLHSKKIVYGDLKPENILFLKKSLDSQIKLIDLSPCQYLPNIKNRKLHRVVGTAMYMAPEMILKDYNHFCDIWSAGVILYMMLSGVSPFLGISDNDIKESILKRKYDFHSSGKLNKFILRKNKHKYINLIFKNKYIDWENISYEAKDLIKKMLCSVEKRITIEQIYKHPWIVHQAPNDQNRIVFNNLKVMKSFAALNKFQKIVILILASRLKDEEINDLKIIFNSIDTNHDGALNLDEFREALKSDIHMTKDLDIDYLFKCIDVNESGYIDYSEFLAATFDRKRFLTEEKLTEIFKIFDLNGDGTICLSELNKQMNLTAKYETSIIEEDFKKADKNNDIRVDYNEFLYMMKKK